MKIFVVSVGFVIYTLLIYMIGIFREKEKLCDRMIHILTKASTIEHTPEFKEGVCFVSDELSKLV